MMQYGHIYTAFYIIIKLKVMFWKLYTRIDFNVGTFNYYFGDGILFVDVSLKLLMNCISSTSVYRTYCQLAKI